MGNLRRKQIAYLSWFYLALAVLSATVFSVTAMTEGKINKLAREIEMELLAKKAKPAAKHNTEEVKAEDPTGKQLGQVLVQQAGGKSVLLAAGKTGLLVRTADGTWSRTLVSGPIDYAGYDPAKDLAWLLRGGKLDVVDLRAKDSTPIPILTGVPFDGFEISGASSTAFRGDPYNSTHVVLHWSKKPTITHRAPADTSCDDDACERKDERRWRRELRKVRIVGKKWLKQQLNRTPRPLASAKSKPEATTVVKLPAGWADCKYRMICEITGCGEFEEDEPLCGQATPFGATGLLLVIAQYNANCVLYDPARKLFASLLSPNEWSATEAMTIECDSVEFDLTGTSYLVDSNDVCSVTAGCVSLDDTTAFWLRDQGHVLGEVGKVPLSFDSEVPTPTGWVGTWSITTVDDPYGDMADEQTIELSENRTFIFRAILDDPRLEEPEEIVRKGRYTTSAKSIRIPELSSGLSRCRLLSKLPKRKANAIKKGCAAAMDGHHTVYFWYETSGPVRRVLEKWTRKTETSESVPVVDLTEIETTSDDFTNALLKGIYCEGGAYGGCTGYAADINGDGAKEAIIVTFDSCKDDGYDEAADKYYIGFLKKSGSNWVEIPIEGKYPSKEIEWGRLWMDCSKPLNGFCSICGEYDDGNSNWGCFHRKDNAYRWKTGTGASP